MHILLIAPCRPLQAAVLAIANIYYGILHMWDGLGVWAWASYTAVLAVIVAVAVVKDVSNWRRCVPLALRAAAMPHSRAPQPAPSGSLQTPGTCARQPATGTSPKPQGQPAHGESNSALLLCSKRKGDDRRSSSSSKQFLQTADVNGKGADSNGVAGHRHGFHTAV